MQKITVLGGFTCPNRDGTISDQGCSYCNNKTFSAPEKIKNYSITDQINHGIETSKRRYKVDQFFVYFQAYTNTYAPLYKLKKLYEEALSHPKVIGLCIGTRPDCIDREKMEYIASLAEKHEIVLEYGLESISDETLTKINRGHDFETLVNAITLTNSHGIDICAHLIIGFPWEDKDFYIQTAKVISSLPIKYLKIHQLHVVKETPLALEYEDKPFKLLGKEEYQEILLSFLENLNPDIVIQRLYSESPKELIVAPHWDTTTGNFVQEFTELMIEKKTFQGRLYKENQRRL